MAGSLRKKKGGRDTHLRPPGKRSRIKEEEERVSRLGIGRVATGKRVQKSRVTRGQKDKKKNSPFDFSGASPSQRRAIRTQ